MHNYMNMLLIWMMSMIWFMNMKNDMMLCLNDLICWIGSLFDATALLILLLHVFAALRGKA